MTDIRANVGAARTKQPHRHRVFRDAYGTWCSTCHEAIDPAKSRAGKNARKRGNRRELYVERKYGPTKVGQFGDAIDNIGSTFKWQSKTTTALPPLWAGGGIDGRGRYHAPLSGIRGIAPARWFTGPMQHMEGLRDDLLPLVIRSWTHQGRHSLDVIVVRADDWAVFHDDLPEPGRWEHYAMTGDYFLDAHGRDER